MSSICDDLRAAILQAAMQGKLTKQLPEDGTAEELLEQIKVEKEKLIAKGKIKKQKPLAPITDDEIPFSIPDNWVWFKLEDISRFIGNKSNQVSEKSALRSGLYPIVSQSKENIIGYSNSFDKVLHVDKDVVVFGDHTALVKYIDFDFIIGADGVKVIEPIYLDTKFLYFALSYHLIGVGGGHGYSRHYKFIKDKPLAIPPLSEQKRIVEKIDELMARVADLEKSADALASLKKSFPDDIKASLLQAAMQGKLTKQLPEDGTAEELLNRIHEQKKTANKKIRPLIDSDKLFMIPNTWAWTKLGEIIDFDIGKTPPRADTSYWGTDIPWVSIADMPKNGILLSTKEKVSNKALKEKFNSKIVPKGTLLMSFKLTVGRCSILGIDAVHNEAIISMRPVVDDDFILRDYLAKVLPILSNYGETKDAIKGKTLNSDSLNNLPIPLPPLAEQKRIIERLDSLMQNIEVISQLIMGE